MNRKLLGLILSAVFISVCVGCGAENTTKEQAETDSAIIIEEGTPETLEEVTETSEETLEPTLGVTEEPSEETTTETDIETPTIESTETVVPEHGEEPIPEPQAIYTYTDMSATMYAQQTVNARDLPDTNGNKLGSLSTNEEITITGQCNETSWYRFEYNGGVAYVSDKYVGENKVEVQQQASTDNSGSSSAASNSCPYTSRQQVHDGVRISSYVTQPDPGPERNRHSDQQKGIYDTLSDRNRDNIPPGYFGYSEQIEWIYMGTYAEGNVYKQTFEYRVYPKDS